MKTLFAFTLAGTLAVGMPLAVGLVPAAAQDATPPASTAPADPAPSAAPSAPAAPPPATVTAPPETAPAAAPPPPPAAAATPPATAPALPPPVAVQPLPGSTAPMPAAKAEPSAPVPARQPADRSKPSPVEARLTKMKESLKLTAAQEPLWPPVETAVREMINNRAARRSEFQNERREARATKTAPDPIERMRDRAKSMAAWSADMTKVADAAEPLYASLDEAQKRRFAAALRSDGPERPAQARREGARAEARRSGEEPAPRARAPREEPSMFERLQRDVQRSWQELWE